MVSHKNTIAATAALALVGCAGRNIPPRSTAIDERPAVYVDRSTSDAAALSPAQAKAVIVARSAGVDLSVGGSGSGTLGGSQLTYEVCGTASGWLVVCKGAALGEGNFVLIDRSWKSGKVVRGKKPPSTLLR